MVGTHTGRSVRPQRRVEGAGARCHDSGEQVRRRNDIFVTRRTRGIGVVVHWVGIVDRNRIAADEQRIDNAEIMLRALANPRFHHRPVAFEYWWKVRHRGVLRSEEHTSELQSLMRISYAAFCLKQKTHKR